MDRASNRPKNFRSAVKEDIDDRLGIGTNVQTFGSISQGITSPAAIKGSTNNATGTDAQTIAALAAVTNFAVTGEISAENPDGSYMPYNLLTWTKVEDARLQAYLVFGSTGLTTTVMTQCDAGDTSVEVSDGSIFTGCEYIYLFTGGDFDIIPIDNVAGNIITFKTYYIAHYTYGVGATCMPFSVRAKLASGSELYMDFDIVGSTTYYYCIASYSVLNTMENVTDVVSVLSARDNTPPAAPTGFTADFTGKDAIMWWDKAPELDFKTHKLNIYAEAEKTNLIRSIYQRSNNYIFSYADNVSLATGAGLASYGDPSLYCEVFAIDQSDNVSTGAGLAVVNDVPITPTDAPTCQGFGRMWIARMTATEEKDDVGYYLDITYSGTGTHENYFSMDDHTAIKVAEADVALPIDVKYKYRDAFQQYSAAWSPTTTFTPEEITFIDVNSQTFYCDITDSPGTAAGVLAGLFDDDRTTVVNVEYGTGAWNWIQYDFHFDYKFDFVGVWSTYNPRFVVVCEDDAGNTVYYASQAPNTQPTNGVLTAYGSLADAQTNYWRAVVGENVAKFPNMVKGRKCRLYTYTTVSSKFMEIRFDIVEIANRFIGETLTLSNYITIASKNNTNDAIKMTTTGLKCYTADDDDLYYTEFNSLGLEAYVNAALKTRIGRLAANVFGIWSILAAFGGTGYTDATVFADSGGLTVKDGSAGTGVGWIGKSGSTVGGWFKTLGIGGTSYADAKIVADASGNIQILRSVTVGGATDLLMSNADTGTNILPNGGFEQIKATGAYAGDTGFIPCWTCAVSGAGNIIVYSAVAVGAGFSFGGRYLIDLQSTTTAFSQVTSVFIPAAAARKFQLSFYAKRGAIAITLTAKIDWYNSASALISTSTIAAQALTTTLTRYSGSATSPAGTFYAQVYFYTNVVASGTGEAFLDSCQLEVGEVVSPFREPSVLDGILPLGVVLDDKGTRVFYSGDERVRAGDIGGLSTGSGAGLIAANTMGLWVKGSWYQLDNDGNIMIGYDGIRGNAFMSETIAQDYLTAALQAKIETSGSDDPTRPHDFHLAIMGDAIIQGITEFPHTVAHGQSNKPAILSFFRGRDTDSPYTYSSWYSMPAYEQVSAPGWVLGANMISRIGADNIVFDVSVLWFNPDNVYLQHLSVSGGNNTNFALYADSGTGFYRTFDEFEIRYYVLKQGLSGSGL